MPKSHGYFKKGARLSHRLFLMLQRNSTRSRLADQPNALPGQTVRLQGQSSPFVVDEPILVLPPVQLIICGEVHHVRTSEARSASRRSRRGPVPRSALSIPRVTRGGGTTCRLAHYAPPGPIANSSTDCCARGADRQALGSGDPLHERLVVAVAGIIAWGVAGRARDPRGVLAPR